MDKFGQGRTNRGPPGPKGKDAFNLRLWCPEALLEFIRRSESCTYFFNTLIYGILVKGGKPIGLKDRYGQNHAICLKDFEKPRRLYEIFVLPLEGSMYRIQNIQQALASPTLAMFGLSFKVSKALTGVHYIFTNQTKSRGVYISEKSLNICGTDPLQLEYNYKDWNRLIIQYTCFEGYAQCFFMLNGVKGFFTKDEHTEIDHTIFIGGHPDEKHPSNVFLANFEIYGKSFTLGTNLTFLPNDMIGLIDENFRDRIS